MICITAIEIEKKSEMSNDCCMCMLVSFTTEKGNKKPSDCFLSSSVIVSKHKYCFLSSSVIMSQHRLFNRMIFFITYVHHVLW